MAFYTYDSSKLSIVINGIPIDGFADGTVVTVERDEDSFTKMVGTDGEVTRSKTNNKSGSVTLTLTQSSKSNRDLTGIFVLDEKTGNGVGPFLMKYKNGLSLYSAENCWIRKPPSAEWGREATNREWIIDVDALNIFEGGL